MKRLVQSYRLQSYRPWIVGAVFSCMTLFLAVILISFHEHDPSWFYMSSVEMPTYNKGGVIGAHCAALLFYLLGATALLLIFLCAGVAWFAFRGASLRDEADRLIGYVALILCCAASCNWWSLSWFSFAVPGGVIGSNIVALLQQFTDPLLISLGLLSGLIASVTITSRFLVIVYSLYIVQQMIRFVCSDYVKKPVFACLSWLSSNIRWAARWCWAHGARLLSVEQVEHDHALVSNDFEGMIRQELAQVIHDPIWNNSKEMLKELKTVPVYKSPEQEVVLPVTEQPKPESVENNKPVYTFPAASLFKQAEHDQQLEKRDHDKERARLLEEKLERFGIEGSVVTIKRGPVITLFEYRPTIDTKISKIIALEDDLALALQAVSIRIIAPIPGTSVVGFEVANTKRSPVTLASIIHSKLFKHYDAHLPLVLGVDTVGQPVVVDMVTMPHLLVAGATGSGKSVALNAMLVSLLYRRSPDQMKLILIDPKRLEFASYADIAHLLFPIVTTPQEVIPVLRWVVRQMEERYEIMAKVGVRNIFDYQNRSAKDASLIEMPFIVVIIDELSDLMMTTGKEVEDLIARTAQMARAAGIYMIVATQRPSVDVITGLIKVNFPSRIAFRVTSKVDSRTILDVGGAEKLLGKGDMLFLHAHAQLQRIHGAYVSDQEIHDLVEHIRKERPVSYRDLTKELPPCDEELSEGDDQLYQEVISFLHTVDEISISLLQRKFRIGYNRSARIMELLEGQGYILPHDGSKMRKVVHTHQ